jgi:hypothetical protein
VPAKTAHVFALIHQSTVLIYTSYFAHTLADVCAECADAIAPFKRACVVVHLTSHSICLPHILQCVVNYTSSNAMSGTPSAMIKEDIDAIHQFLCAQAKVTNVIAVQ